MSCPAWGKLVAAYLAGQSGQKAADRAATDKATIDALQQRAKTDDAVRAMPDDAVTRELRQWERGPDPKP